MKLAIEFHCSQCQCELQVGENAVGKKARCPRCGMIHDVPKPSDSAATDTEESPSNAAIESSTKIEAVPGSDKSEDSHSKKSGPPNSKLTTHDVGFRDTVYREPESQLPMAAQHFQQTTAEEPSESGSMAGSNDQLEIPDGGARWSMKTPDGQVYGPVSQEELDSWAAQGRVSAGCLVQMEGNSHWQSALVLYPELSTRKATAGSAASMREYYQTTGRYPDRGVGTDRVRQSQDSTRGNGGVYYARERQGNGGTVLALAIVSLFFTFFPVFGIAAFWIARTEKTAIERGEVTSEGRGMLDVGYAISLLSLAISIVMFFGCCVLSSSF